MKKHSHRSPTKVLQTLNWLQKGAKLKVQACMSFSDPFSRIGFGVCNILHNSHSPFLGFQN